MLKGGNKYDEIIVVGNAQSLFDKELGSTIDSMTTIRINNISLVNKTVQGSRWDYLAGSKADVIEKFNKEADTIPYFIFTRWDHEKCEKTFAKLNKKLYPRVIDINILLSLTLQEKLGGFKPSTGLIILEFLHAIGHDKVSICGFDWKKTKTYYNSDKKETNVGKRPHNFLLEEKYCKSLVEKNNWNLL